MKTFPSSIPPNIASCFERHEKRRQQGCPVLSTLAGDQDAAWHYWASFWEDRGATSCVVESMAGDNMPELLTRLSNARPEARKRLAAWLSARTHRDSGNIESLLRDGVFQERKLLADQAGLCGSPELMVLRSLVTLEPVSTAAEDAVETAWTTLADTLGADMLPALLLYPKQDLVPAELKRELTRMERILQQTPRARLGAALSNAALASIGGNVQDTRLAVLLREGGIALPDTAPTRDALPGPVLPATTLNALPFLRRHLSDAAMPPVIQAFEQALTTRGPGQPKATQDLGRARSAVEYFLHTVLEHYPATRGRFLLNVCVNTRSGLLPRTEVDFLASEERIALEVDGYYHFRDRDAYRHDRRKDLVLQQEGYIVVRFLAEDVMNDLEMVLNTLVSLLEHARKGKRNE